MSFNPYAAPQAEPAAPGPLAAPGEPQPWEVGEVIRAAWEVFKPNWAPLCVGAFVMGLVSAIPQQVPNVLQLSGVLEEDAIALRILTIVTAFVGWLIREYFTLGLMRACVGTVRTGTVRVQDVFGAGGRYGAFVIVSVLTTLATAVGLVLLVVPGIIALLGLWMSRFYVVERGLDPISAMRASWEASRGQKAAFFVLTMAEIGLFLLGFAACCVGFVAASMVAMLARTIVYLRVAGLAQGTRADAARTV